MTTNKKKILVVTYSQTGQLNTVVDAVTQALAESDLCELSYLRLQPQKPYPFPWPFIQFINTFPEAVYEKGCELEPFDEAIFDDYDLIVLGYTVWFLAPANPIAEFLHSSAAEKLLRDKPVLTVIACRNMWLQAQERVKGHLQRLNARLIGNVALTDEGGAGYSFVSTPLWMLTGTKGPFWFGIPKAGVCEEDIVAARRFGDAILARYKSGAELDETVLQGLAAVRINTNQIASEKIATRSFKIWGKLFLLCGKPEAFIRKILSVVYACFLLTLILTVVPLNYCIKRLLSPLTHARNARLREYFAAPSGESNENL